MKLRLRHRIDCCAPDFWPLYFDPEFTRRLHNEGLGSTSIEIVESSGDLATGLRRTLRYSQRPAMPGPVAKLFGAEVVTIEKGVFDPHTGTWSFELTPSALADKTRIRGSFTVEGDSKASPCEQSFELEATVKVFGLGPVVERFIEAQTRQSQDKAAAFMNAVLGGG